MPAILERTQVQEQRLQKQPGKRINWLAVIAMQIVAVLFVEFALYCSGLGEEEYLKIDPELGSMHITNKRITWRSEGHCVTFFNFDGMREPNLTVAKPPGVYRVAMLGDSFTEALQVNLEQTFGQLLEKSLSQELKKPIQVLNFGCSGYSTVQEYLLLKRKVLKYNPDLVVCFYDSRDSFENWSPPDQVIANVRPLALHLPGGKLTVDNAPVTLWMKSPRAKLLKSCEWLRQNSRIWGLLAAAELDLSLHSEAYKHVALFITRPGKAIKQWWKQGQAALADLPQTVGKIYQANSSNHAAPAGTPPPAAKAVFVDVTQGRHAPEREAVKQDEAALAVVDATRGCDLFDKTKKPVESSELSVVADATRGCDLAATEQTIAEAPRKTSIAERMAESQYIQLVHRTLGSLFDEMKKETEAQGGKFAVIAAPVRSALAPDAGVNAAGNGFDYDDELYLIDQACKEKGIPWFNCNHPALKLPLQARKDLFFSVHLTSTGHIWVAETVKAFLCDVIRNDK